MLFTKKSVFIILKLNSKIFILLQNNNNNNNNKKEPLKFIKEVRLNAKHHFLNNLFLQAIHSHFFLFNIINRLTIHTINLLN